jgi:hypothetical protein
MFVDILPQCSRRSSAGKSGERMPTVDFVALACDMGQRPFPIRLNRR